MRASLGCPIMTTSPIVRYPLNSIETLGTNAEGESYNATAKNISIVSDDTFGTAAYFSGDGTSGIDMDTIPTSTLVGNAPRTVSFWINFEIINGNRNIYSQGNLATGKGKFAQVKIGYKATNIRIEYGGIPNQFGTAPLATDTWYHFSYTYDGTDSKLYWNGDHLFTHTVTLDTEAGFVNLGQAFSNGGDFIGKMLDFRIYGIVVPDSDLSNLASEGPAPEVYLRPTMFPYVAHLEWGVKKGASTYTVTYSETHDTSGEEQVADSSTSSNSLVIYDLQNNTMYDFKVYADLDTDSEVALSTNNLTPAIEDVSILPMVEFISNDLTVLAPETVADIQPHMGSQFDTGQVVWIRAKFNETLSLTKSKFVKDGETYSISQTDESILTPFIENGSSGQFFTIELPDQTTQTVYFDETTGSVIINGETYLPGKSLVLGGKCCKVALLD